MSAGFHPHMKTQPRLQGRQNPFAHECQIAIASLGLGNAPNTKRRSRQARRGHPSSRHSWVGAEALLKRETKVQETGKKVAAIRGVVVWLLQHALSTP